jgi:hypothetical protein
MKPIGEEGLYRRLCEIANNFDEPWPFAYNQGKTDLARELLMEFYPSHC